MKIFLNFGSKRMLFYVLFIVIFFPGLAWFIHSQVEGSEPYLIAKQFLVNNTEVVQYLGEPQKLSLNILGGSRMRESGLEGNAKIDVGIVGAKDNGKAVVELQKRDGIWRITSGLLFLKNGNQIALKEDNQAR